METRLRLIALSLHVVSVVGACSDPSATAVSGPQRAAAQAGQGATAAVTPPLAAGAASPEPSSAATLIRPSQSPSANASEVQPSAAGETCARAELAITRTVPTVWLLVDGSGSMAAPLEEDLTGPSRWTLLREALVGDGTGLVSRLQGSVAFGLYVYDGGLSLPGIAGPQCPRTVVTAPALDNAAAMAAAYPADPIGASTPTHYALLDLKRRIDEAGPDPRGPTYVVLATDGKPNLCDFHDGIPSTPDTEQEAVSTVLQLAAAGTRSFVISMAGSDADLQAHLQTVAAAGGTQSPAFSPVSKDDLLAALQQIIGETASCELQLKGEVQSGRECTGSVVLNGAAVPCNDPDGYRLNPDRRSLALQGAACAQLQAAAAPVLKATFPCEDVTLF